MLFPFGHGLSYTSFQQRNLHLQVRDGHLDVSLELENTGEVAGAEVVQVYTSQLAPSVSRPIKELKGFLKIFLLPKQVEEVKIDIPMKYATSFWDESLDAWISEAGTYEVFVGNSSASLFPLRGTFHVPVTVSWNGL